MSRDGVGYCVWAPDHERIELELRRVDGSTATLPLEARGDGYFAAVDERGRSGDRYGFRLGPGPVLPDPTSRFQPDGVHGLSQCVDPAAYSWRANRWQRPRWRGQSIYEIHVGTFTPRGTFQAAIEQLDHVAELGVDAIELMPVADFPGGRNWGYDGVALFAPARCYGTPDDLRALIDAAHERGLAVILDVVYNHLGPDGNYLSRFAAGYFHAEHHTPWGKALNLSGPGSGPVRAYFRQNVAYWLDEFRIDGLRLDATHALVDDMPPSVLAELADVAHARSAFLIAEDERNRCEILRRPDGTGAGLDATWSDDFHHQIRVAVTGVQEGYFLAYGGTTEDVVRTLENGWYYTGQPFPFWRGQPRGEPCAHLPQLAHVSLLENHDQVGNRARGERLEHLISAAAYRAASALLCLTPYPPLLFMGQEWAASTPFLYFTNHHGELGQLVSEGRRKEFSGTGLANGLAFHEVPDPQDAETFRRSKLVWDELRLSPHAGVLELYKACLRQRAGWLQDCTSRERWQVGAVGELVVIRYAPPEGPERLVISSLRGSARVTVGQSPLLAPTRGAAWQLALDSNAVGGGDSLTTIVSTGAQHPAIESLAFGSPATLLLVSQPRGGGQVS